MVDYTDFLLTYNYSGIPAETIAVLNPDIVENKYIITYTLLKNQQDALNVGYYSSVITNNFATSTYKQNVEDAFLGIFSGNFGVYSSLFQDVANISFSEETNGTGIIAVGQYDANLPPLAASPSTSAFADTGNNIAGQHGDIFINTEHDSNGAIPLGYNVWDVDTQVVPGTAAFKILMEEISHSLGVDIYRPENRIDPNQQYHPQNNPLKPEFEYLNNHKYTVTAYNSHPDMDYDGVASDFFIGDATGPFPTTLSLFDIAALQEIYGINTATRNENEGFDDGDSDTTGTRYAIGKGFGDTKDDAFVYTIWDGGGSTDTIDASGYDDGAQIDLRQGHFSSIGKNGNLIGSKVIWDSGSYDAGNVAIAYGTEIENAVGTGDDDEIIGNDLDNTLTGGLGNDTLYGGAGNDTYVYNLGDGDDTIIESEGINLIFGTGITQANTAYSKSNDDLIMTFSDGGTLRFINYFTPNSGQFSTIVYGDNSTIETPATASYIYGTENNDTLAGSAGNDNIFGLNGDDFIDGGDGNDTLRGGGGDDIIIARDTGDNIYGDDGNDVIYAGNGSSGTGVYGGNGNDILHGGQGGQTRLRGEGGDDTLYLNDNSFGSYAKGGSGNDTIYGNSTNGNMNLQGEDGDDSIYALYSANMYGGSGVNHMYGGTQGGRFYFNDGDDHAYGSGDQDALNEFHTQARNIGNGVRSIGNNIIHSNGEGGNDRIWLNGFSNDDVYISISGNDVILQSVADNIIGSITVKNHLINANPIKNLKIYETYVFNGEFDFSDLNKWILGNAISETLNGTINDDIIFSNGGSDTLNGLAGDDDLVGGKLSDQIYGGEDNDKAYGGRGDDYIYGGNGNDTLYGNIGDDYLQGGDGNDNLYGGDGNDYLVGGLGEDELGGGGGDDIIYFETVNDLSGDRIAGDNQVGAKDKIVFGETIFMQDLSFEELDYGNGRVSLLLNFGSDQLELRYQLSTQSFLFSRVDTLEFFNGYIFDLENYQNWFAGVTNHSGDLDDETIIGLSSNDTINGAGGNDDIFGEDGDDVIIGGDGDDVLTGGVGADSFIFNSLSEITDNADHITDLETVDNIDLSAITGLDFIGDSEFSNIVNQMRYVFENGTTAIEIDSTGDGIRDHRIVIDNGEFGLQENSGILSISLYPAGAIVGTAGNDILTGTSNDDVLIGLAGDDILNGGDGIDTVDYSSASSAVTVSIHSSTASDAEGGTDTLINIENIIGSSFNDTLIGNNALDNTIWAGSGHDHVQGRAGGDILYGEDGNDDLRGANGDDVLYGGAGNDTLYGQNHDDILYGGLGLDALWGNSGADTFVFEANSAFLDLDNVKDFDLTEGDKLDLSDLLVSYDPIVDLITDFVQITDNGVHSYVSVDTDGGADNFQQIAQLSSVTGLTDEATLESNGTLIV